MKQHQVRNAAVLLAAVLIAAPQTIFAQTPAPPPPTTPGTVAQPSEPVRLSPDQLENLVAPIALYPDPLLSQVLAASTYPLEVVEAQQWLQQHPDLKGQQLVEAAKQQNWDPSVQALVAFPDVLALLNRDIQWTTDLGNAFLAQQDDVMAAIQTMRRRARQNGKLTSTAQETVTTDTQNGQSVVVIQPADPQVIYVPVYNPVYVWGPPVWGYYPPLWYPAVSFGFGFGPGIYLGAFFPGWGIGWGGWGVGWGWGLSWFGGGIYVNPFFFHQWGFEHVYYGGHYFAGGRMAWAHDSFHREGVPYANRAVAAQYNNARFAAGRYNAGSSFAARSSANGGWRSFNNNAGARSFAPQNRGAVNNFNRGTAAGNYNRGESAPNRGYSAPNTNRGYSSPAPSYNRSYSAPSNNRSYSAPSYNRSYSAPSYNRSYSAPSYNRSYSAPNVNRGFSSPSFNRGFSAPNSGARSFSAPRSSGGGFGGGHSFGGGSRGGRR